MISGVPFVDVNELITLRRTAKGLDGLVSGRYFEPRCFMFLQTVIMFLLNEITHMNVYSCIIIRRIILFVNTLGVKAEGFDLTLYYTLQEYNKLQANLHAMCLIHFKYKIRR
jgi:hypothetical protein